MSPDTVERRLPGDLAMWFFILAELSVFSLLGKIGRAHV